MRKFFEICPRRAPRPPVPPGPGLDGRALQRRAQAVTAPECSSLPRPGCHRWLHPTPVLRWALSGTRLPIRERPHCVASATRVPPSSPFAKARADLRSGADGASPTRLPAHLKEGGGDEGGKPLGDPERTAGRSAAPQRWEKLGRVDRTQRLTLQSKGGLGKTWA